MMLSFKSISDRLAVLLMVTSVCLCAPFAFAAEKSPSESADVEVEVLSEGEVKKDTFEQKQEEWSEIVRSTATWMDAFFDDGRYKTTTNKTYLRLRLSPIIDRNGLSLNTYVDLRLLLPNSERWLLNVGGDPDKESQYGSSSVEDREREDSGRNESNAYVGLNTFLKRTRTRNVGFGGGLTYRSTGIIPYGAFKWVELWEFNNWDLRGSQRFRYYTDTGAESKTTVDVEWPFAKKFFFRTSGSALFKVENPISNYDVDYSIYQYLSSRRALHYKIRTGYTSTPSRSTYMDRTIGEVEYRQQWRDWFYTAITPQIASYDARDWDLEPGIRIDFNFRIGHVDEYTFKSPYQHKQETNEIKAREDRDKALEEGHERMMEWQRQQDEKKL